MFATKQRFGFTLVETLVGVALLLMFFASVVAIFDVVTKLVGEARIRIVATALATEKMEIVRNMTFQDIGTQGGIPSGVLAQNEIISVNGQDFSVNTTIVYIDDPYDDISPTDPVPTDYKRVRISVSWGGAFPSRVPVAISTDVVPNGIEASEGGGTLFINVINSSGEAVADAQVSIINTTVDPQVNLNISTNNQGRVVLPGAPMCSDCYNITVTKQDYSTDRTYSSQEVANPHQPIATIIEGEITSLTFSIDRSARLTVRTTGSRASNYPAFAGVQFYMQGSKTIGTNEFDQPVYKYDQTLVSGPGGQLVLENMEPDTYEVWIPSGASVDFAGSAPISPFALFPAGNQNLTIVTEAATPHNLLVVVQNTVNQPVSTASAMLTNSLGNIATASAGPSGFGDNGQVLFRNLVPGLHQIQVSQIGYKTASTSAAVSGDTKTQILLEHE